MGPETRTTPGLVSSGSQLGLHLATACCRHVANARNAQECRQQSDDRSADETSLSCCIGVDVTLVGSLAFFDRSLRGGDLCSGCFAGTGVHVFSGNLGCRITGRASFFRSGRCRVGFDRLCRLLLVIRNRRCLSEATAIDGVVTRGLGRLRGRSRLRGRGRRRRTRSSTRGRARVPGPRRAPRGARPGGTARRGDGCHRR